MAGLGKAVEEDDGHPIRAGRAGFEDVESYHRHGMSWTVIGRKPA